MSVNTSYYYRVNFCVNWSSIDFDYYANYISRKIPPFGFMLHSWTRSHSPTAVNTWSRPRCETPIIMRPGLLCNRSNDYCSKPYRNKSAATSRGFTLLQRPLEKLKWARDEMRNNYKQTIRALKRPLCTLRSEWWRTAEECPDSAAYMWTFFCTQSVT